ncbi:hypothetical protein ACET9K_11700 [Aeromonas enteropelogenes]|uniref:hypothetical protein n=1 Tax=Aeromonas enteropelogenes TaxID=29489 RepID=UPI0038D2020A
MHRIDTSTAQKDKFGAGKNGFTLGNAQTGVPPTEVSADILDAMQEEICAVIEDPESGMSLDKQKNNQLSLAIKSVISKKLRDIGLTKYGAPMIGVPIDWPLAQLPQDIFPDCGMVFLSCAGQSFNKTAYPIAAQLYPSGVMPEHRARFVRGWDNGLGKDPGRELLSFQAAAIQSHDHSLLQRFYGAAGSTTSSGKGEVRSPGVSGSEIGSYSAGVGASGGPETRPDSIAYHKIMRVG